MKNLLKTFSAAIIALTFILSPVFVSIQDNQTDTLISAETSVAQAINLGCDITDVSCGVTEAALDFYEVILYDITTILAGLTAMLLDFILEYSIDSSTYKTGIIEIGWEMIRDITNIGFIFALLISAFQIALGFSDAEAKKRVMKTILVALTVNFSLFISYVVIDLSNVLAHTFYNKIEVKGTAALAGPDGENILDNELSSLSLFSASSSPSVAILSTFNPQKILQNVGDNAKETNISQVALIITMAGIVNILIIWIFISVLLIFISRIIGLMMLCIASPLAMISMIIPGLQGNKYIGFENWFSQLFKLAFTAPIFLFFLLLIAKMNDGGGKIFSLAAAPDQGFIGAFLSVLLPFSIVIGFLYLAKKVTTDMAGDLGAIGGKVLAGAVAVGAVVATGGVAAAGGLSSGLGSVASKLGSTKTAARLKNYGGQLASTKLDVTKIPGFSSAAGSGMTNAIAKVTGKSATGHINAGRSSFNEWKNEKSNFQKDREELAKLKEKNAKDSANKPGFIEGRKTSSYQDWRSDMEKAVAAEKEKAVVAKIQEEEKKKLKTADGIPALRKTEEAAYNAMIDNADSVKKEEKALTSIADEIKDLNTQLNSAKGSGADDRVINKIQNNINAKKVVEAARKKGVELTNDQAVAAITKSGTHKNAINDIKSQFGADAVATLGGGREINKDDVLKSRHEFDRSQVQEKEKKALRSAFGKREAKIKDINSEKGKAELKALRKALKQKQSELLTDSSKDSSKDSGKDKKDK